MATVRRFAASVALLVVVISECRGQCDKYKRAKLLHASTTSIAIVTSPGYPDTDYPNDAQCSWQIVAEDPSLVIQLHINELQLDSDYANCRYDYVDLFDGNYYYNGLKHGTAILARLCSTKYGRNIYSTSPYMYVRFVTDPRDTAKGFSFGVRALPRSQVSTPAPGRVTTPMYYKGKTSTATTSSRGERTTPVIAAVVGGTIGAFLGFALLITLLVCLCRRCLGMSGGRTAGGGAAGGVVCTTVPCSLPPPEDARQGSGRTPPAGPVSYTVLTADSDAAPSSRQGGRPEPHRGGNNGDGHNAGGPGGRLEPPPGRNSRSGSPRSSPGGSPRHGRHLDVPERGHGSGSPERGHDGSRTAEQGHRSRSPERGHRSGTAERGHGSRSPGGGRNPGQSHRPRSPGGSGRPRSSGSQLPPVPPPPDRGRPGYEDPPPSYSEVMGASPQPSAPPLPPAEEM